MSRRTRIPKITRSSKTLKMCLMKLAVIRPGHSRTRYLIPPGIGGRYKFVMHVLGVIPPETHLSLAETEVRSQCLVSGIIAVQESTVSTMLLLVKTFSTLGKIATHVDLFLIIFLPQKLSEGSKLSCGESCIMRKLAFVPILAAWLRVILQMNLVHEAGRQGFLLINT